MKKISRLLTLTFISLFSINCFATSITVPLDLSPTKTAPIKTNVLPLIPSPINPITEVVATDKKILSVVKQYNNAAPLNIAVASNFKVTAQHIAEQFSHAFGIPVNISSASTATLYQQILRGAPFDLFLSADKKHIELLMEKNRVEQQTGFVYAQGQLVFWQPKIEQEVTIDDFFEYNGRLAIANPKFAPYGIAAQETLLATNKWKSQQYIKGNNINQAYQFVESGNVPAGLVSYTAVVQKHQNNYVIIPQKWYQPIEQIGIILNRKRLEETNLFRQFILSDSIQLYINTQGYN